jgi:hypothetical protein
MSCQSCKNIYRYWQSARTSGKLTRKHLNCTSILNSKPLNSWRNNYILKNTEQPFNVIFIFIQVSTNLIFFSFSKHKNH